MGESTQISEPRSDAELARLAQGGDKEAFVAIVARHQALVCGTAYGILNDFGASEDAGQEAFLNAWKKIGDLREPEKLRPWLAQIARNVALRKLRGRRDAGSLDEIGNAVDQNPLPDEVIASEEEAAVVREHLAKLPEKYRLPLVLYYREGQSVRAVAEALDISESAVKKRLERGRTQLRERVVGLIESTLTRTAPSAIFTMAVATAIGALKAPAAVAAGAFSGSAAASVTAVSTAAAKSSGPVLTAMTTSQIPYVAAAIVAAVCLPIGYSAHRGLEKDHGSGSERESVGVRLPSYEPRNAVDAWPDSALLAEWKRLHETHGTDAEAMVLIFAEIQSMSDGFRRRAFLAAIVAEWAQVDPAGGFAALQGKKNRSLRKRLFHEWVRADVDGAINALMEESSGWVELAKGELKEIANRRPGRLVELVAKMPAASGFFNVDVSDAFGVLARHDRQGALAAAEGLKGKNRQEALAGIAQVWGKQDVEAAMAWVSGLAEGAERDEILRHVMFGLAEVSPLAALSKIELVPRAGHNSYFASTTGARVLKVAVEADFEGTMVWLAENPKGMEHDELEGVAEAVTARLNEGAVMFLDARLADGSLGVVAPAIYSSMMNGSAGKIGEIWKWLVDQEEEPGIEKLRRDALDLMAYNDPLAALEMAELLDGKSPSPKMLERLAGAVMGQEGRLEQLDEFYAEAPELMKEPILREAFERLDSSGMKPLRDPQRWAEFVNLMPQMERSGAARNLAHSWAAIDPAGAAEWVIGLELGGAKIYGAAGVAEAWSQLDSLAASEWVAGIPEGRVRDSGARALSGMIVDDLPQEAWTWATSIDSPDLRREALLDVVRRIKRGRHSEVIDLADWVRSSELEEDVTESLMKIVEEELK